MSENQRFGASPETTERVMDHIRTVMPEGSFSLSYRQCADALHIGRETAARALRGLVEDGRLEVTRVGTGSGYPTRYRIVHTDGGAA